MDLSKPSQGKRLSARIPRSVVTKRPRKEDSSDIDHPAHGSEGYASSADGYSSTKDEDVSVSDSDESEDNHMEEDDVITSETETDENEVASEIETDENDVVSTETETETDETDVVANETKIDKDDVVVGRGGGGNDSMDSMINLGEEDSSMQIDGTAGDTAEEESSGEYPSETAQKLLRELHLERYASKPAFGCFTIPGPCSIEQSDDDEDTAVTGERLVDHPGAEKRFRDWYMSRVTAAFGDSLDRIRQQDNLNPNKLRMLVKSLEEGAALYTDDERELVLRVLEKERRTSSAHGEDKGADELQEPTSSAQWKEERAERIRDDNQSTQGVLLREDKPYKQSDEKKGKKRKKERPSKKRKQIEHSI